MAITAPSCPHHRVLSGGNAPYLSEFTRRVRRDLARNQFHPLHWNEEPILIQALMFLATPHFVSSGLVRWYTGDQDKTPLTPATVTTTVTQ